MGEKKISFLFEIKPDGCFRAVFFQELNFSLSLFLILILILIHQLKNSYDEGIFFSYFYAMKNI